MLQFMKKITLKQLYNLSQHSPNQLITRFLFLAIEPEGRCSRSTKTRDNWIHNQEPWMKEKHHPRSLQEWRWSEDLDSEESKNGDTRLQGAVAGKKKFDKTPYYILAGLSRTAATKLLGLWDVVHHFKCVAQTKHDEVKLAPHEPELPMESKSNH